MVTIIHNFTTPKQNQALLRPVFQASPNPQTYAYSFDRAGNRLSESVDSVQTDYEYNNLNQLTKIDGVLTHTYDANGNMTSNGYTWDRANRLKSAGGSSYEYDGLGNRISQTVNSVVTTYLNDVQPGLTKVLRQSTGADDTFYIHTPRGVLYQQNPNGDWLNLLSDGLGSTRGVVDENGNFLEGVFYDPFGTPDAPLTNTDIHFTGEFRDANGLQYHRARYYDPSLGVWVSLDPLETPNRYGYVSGNVVNRRDPSGLQENVPGPVEFCRSQPGIFKGLCFSQLLAAGATIFEEMLDTDDPIYKQLEDSETLRRAATESWIFAGTLMHNYLGFYGSAAKEIWRLGEARYVNMCRALNSSAVAKNALQTNFVNCVLRSDQSTCISIDPGIQSLERAGTSLLDFAINGKGQYGSSYWIGYGDWRFRIGFDETTPDLRRALGTLSVGPYSHNINIIEDGNDLVFRTQLEFWDNYDWINHDNPTEDAQHPFGMMLSDFQSVEHLRLAKPYTVYGSIGYSVRVKNCNVGCIDNIPLDAFGFESSIECVNPPGNSENDFITVSLGTADYQPRHTSENTDNVLYYP